MVNLDHIRQAAEWAKNATTPQTIGGVIRAYDECQWDDGIVCNIWGAANLLAGQGPISHGPTNEWSFQSREHRLITAMMRSSNEVPDQIISVLQGNLQGLNFDGVDLSGLDLSELDLSRTSFCGAILRNVKFCYSKLVGTQFCDAILRDANFSFTNLKDVDFSGAKIRNAHFREAKLNGTQFSGANVYGADFKNTFWGIDKTPVLLTLGEENWTNLSVEKIDKKTENLRIGNLYYITISQEDKWSFLSKTFSRVMNDQGKMLYREICSYVLTGSKASRNLFTKSLEYIKDVVRTNDIVMLYIACHGANGIFQTRDGVIQSQEIRSYFSKLPCQTIVFNDSCESSDWVKDDESDPIPSNMTILCGATTGNSTIEFSTALFEGLYGKADLNRDGIVDLDELIQYCKLRIREIRGGTLVPVIHKAKNLTKLLPLTKTNHNLISVVYRREVFAALVEKIEEDNFFVDVIGFDKKGVGSGLAVGNNPIVFHRSKVILPSDSIPLMVRKENGGWYPACLLNKVEENSYKVRFIGTDGEIIVTNDRIRHLFAGKIDEDIPPQLFRFRRD